ncbi:hypothetical protein [Actinomadura roseirufa]|nr:hypothetical protein [Actinomadura roseirufa]
MAAPGEGPDEPPVLLVHGWVCGSCGGGGIASDGSTCSDCHGLGHTT